MFKKSSFVAAALVFAFIIGAAGTQNNPLIPREWLETEYRRQLLLEMETVIESAVEKETDRILSPGGGVPLVPISGGDIIFKFAPVNSQINLREGHRITFAQGTEFIVSASIEIELLEGELIDLTSGEITVSLGNGETPVLSELVENRLYLLPEKSSARIDAVSDITVYANGWYAHETTEHNVFRDVLRTDWFYNAVDFVYKNGYFRGTGEDIFSPSGEMTRAMFVTVLYRLAGEPAAVDNTNTVELSDVTNPEAYYYEAVRWGASREIVRGYEDGTFKPDNRVTREQMASLLYRYALYIGQSVSYGDDIAEDFPDWAEVSEYAREAFRWACGNAVINGSNGNLLPKQYSTRAQVAQMMLNYHENIPYEVQNEAAAQLPDASPDTTPDSMLTETTPEPSPETEGSPDVQAYG